MKTAYRAKRLVTCDPSRSTAQNSLGTIEDGTLIVSDGNVDWVGSTADVPVGSPPPAEHVSLLTPGLIDSHTHAAWTGSRHAEYAIRMAGGDYRAIAEAGGGILSSHRAIASVSEDTLAEELVARLRTMASLGVTSVEVKSGYGLTTELELKQLRAIRKASSDVRAPHVVPTFLALHALPESARKGPSERAAYIDNVIRTTLPQVGDLAQFVDAYIDANAFTIEEAEKLCAEAKTLSHAIRLHVGQFADIGGAELAARVGAHSADHLEEVGDAGITALAEANVVATMLPTACFTLGQRPPPVEKIRAAGVSMAVASDANPGTAPTESLPLAMAIAVRFYRMTPEEVILGTTRIAARSLGLEDRGVLAAGKRADFVSWDLPHETALVQPWGVSKAAMVVSGGSVIG